MQHAKNVGGGGLSPPSAEGLLGIAKTFINFFSDSQQAFRARIRHFRSARGQP